MQLLPENLKDTGQRYVICAKVGHVNREVAYFDSDPEAAVDKVLSHVMVNNACAVDRQDNNKVLFFKRKDR